MEFLIDTDIYYLYIHYSLIRDRQTDRKIDKQIDK